MENRELRPWWLHILRTSEAKGWWQEHWLREDGLGGREHVRTHQNARTITFAGQRSTMPRWLTYSALLVERKENKDCPISLVDSEVQQTESVPSCGLRSTSLSWNTESSRRCSVKGFAVSHHFDGPGPLTCSESCEQTVQYRSPRHAKRSGWGTSVKTKTEW
jgi:hypothetical protein